MTTIYETRRRRLWEEMHSRFTERKQVALAEVLGVSPDYVSRMFSSKHPKRIGEQNARDYEAKLGKPPYWLDGLDLRWPFTSVSYDRIRALSPAEEQQIETVLDTALTLLEQQRQSRRGDPDWKSRRNTG